MIRILRMAGAAALALMAMGLAACDVDDVKSAAIPLVKSAAVDLAVDTVKGDAAARDRIVAVLAGYCALSEADRLALREVFRADGRAAVTIDCDAVAALREHSASLDPPNPGMPPRMLALARTHPARRQLE